MGVRRIGKELRSEHWMLIAGFLTVVSMQLGTAGDSWEHLTRPGFWGGLLGQLGLLVRAMYSEKPERRRHKRPVEPEPEGENDDDVGI